MSCCIGLNYKCHHSNTGLYLEHNFVNVFWQSWVTKINLDDKVLEVVLKTCFWSNFRKNPSNENVIGIFITDMLWGTCYDNLVNKISKMINLVINSMHISKLGNIDTGIQVAQLVQKRPKFIQSYSRSWPRWHIYRISLKSIKMIHMIIWTSYSHEQAPRLMYEK